MPKENESFLVEITMNNLEYDDKDASTELAKCLNKLKSKTLKYKLEDEADWNDETTYYFKISGDIQELLRLGTELSNQNLKYSRLSN